MSIKTVEIIEQLKSLTMLEAADLVKQIEQDLRNCHTRSRNSVTLSAKKLKDKQRNNWALQLFN